MKPASQAVNKAVFISYARADDEPFVERLFQRLRALGYEPWYDRENMTNDGASFSQAISDAIVRSSRLLLVVGPRSVASQYCRGEWETAQKHCIPVLPLLRLGDYDLIPPSIGKGHAVDVRAARDEAAAFNELHRLLSDPVRPLTPVDGGAPALPDWYVPRPQYIEPLKTALRVGDDLLALTSKQESAALQGIGGIGKTTLAAALCADCEVRRTFTRILWIELGPNADENRVINTMRAAVNGSKEDFEDITNARAAFARALHDEKTLIVLDDVWHGDLVKHYRLGGEDHRLLITTRQKGIVAQLGIQAQAVDRLSDDEALRLLNGRSRRSLSLEEARPIIAYLGGHSLALNLAGAWLLKNALKMPADLLTRLARRADFRDLTLSQSDKNENLELALRLSYDDLDPVQQAQFRALGALAGEASFDLAAAQALWQLMDELDAEDALAALRDAGLLDEGADGRCTQHPLLRSYARALAEQQGELAGLQVRHFDHFFALYADYDRNNDEDTHLALEADWDNIRAALDWGLKEQPEPACDWAWAVQYFMMLRRSSAERLSLLDEALRAAQGAGYQRGEAHTLQALGDLSVLRDELEAARAYYDRALPLYETIGARLGLAHTLRALGYLSARRDELEAARAYYDRALPLYETIGDRLGLAHTLRALGDLSVRRDELEAARAYYDRALPLYETIGDRLGLANTLKALGDLSVRRAELEAARAYYDRALPLYETIGDRLGLANTLLALGELSVRRAELEAARAYYDRALPLYETIGDRLGLAHTLRALGDLSVRRDELEAARACYDRALPLYETIGDRLGLANTLKALGDLSVRRDELEAARAYYDRALPLYETIGARLGLANTLVALGELSVRRDELEAARAYYDRALPLYETIGARLGLANTLVALGELSVRRDELEAARAYYDRALPLYETIGARLGLANTLLALGELSVRRAELEAARAYYDRALPLYETIDARLGLANTLRALGDLSVRRDELEAARAYYDRALPLYETIGARLGLAHTLQALGDLSVRRDELEAARAYYDRALPLYETIGDRLGLAHTLVALGDLSVRRDELEAARAYYDRALPLYETIGARLGLANTLLALGDVHRMKDEYGEAVGRYEAALALGAQIGDFASQLNSLNGLASTYRGLGDQAQACAYAQKFLALAESHPFFRDHPITQRQRGRFAVWGCEGIEAPEDETQVALRQLVEIYQQIGEDGLREVLVQNNIPAEQIEPIIAVVKRMSGE